MGLPSFFKSSNKTLFFVLIIGFIMVPSLGEAQCAMCRAVLESEASGNTAEGVNNGIVYLMAIPYVLVAGIFYFIYRKMRS
ncbi:hypothetical protein NYZ99_03050 [Maribacter litopenaei]|uniref:Uncharacterized protein n=2 Tax=Maribacter litopenaei TaxID=2976127 RepID=A0ABY5YCN5_9FLAO|nr:hypothetical protein [Maribacter litopenaei]UWX56689.1 hypothetical protein NYZ99_03050 [Maribacter litopenaei]